MRAATVTFALSLFFCLMPAFTTAQIYTVTDLGPLAPTGINTWGQVVGNYNGHAYMWTKMRGMQNLGILPSGTFSMASGINDLGVVTGTADGSGTVFSGIPGEPNQTCSSGLVQPFIWNAEHGIRGLGTVSVYGADLFPDLCQAQFYAAGINAKGQVVGYTQLLPNLYQWGFSWTDATGMTWFGGSFPPTFVNGISNTSQIVGENSSNFDAGHATWWSGINLTAGLNSGTTLPELGAPEYESSANGVNDFGQIVGWSTAAPSFGDCFFAEGLHCTLHAVVWSPSGAVSDLGTLSGDTLSSATKINLFGLVIGSSGNGLLHEVGGQVSNYEGFPEVIGRPFIWSQNNGMRDLNTMIRGNSGWVLNTATDINVWGQIVGQGTLRGQPHGFLLTPRAFFKF